MKKDTKKHAPADSVEELKVRVSALKKDLMNLRFQRSASMVKDTSAFSKVRKEIARVQTRINMNNK
jgi:large subunit ribosomal protein L29